MNAMILAAGLGTRLGAMGATTPKILIEVGGTPLLQRHLAYLRINGARRVVINVHHHAERIERFVRSYDGPLEVVCVHEERLLGTAGGVRNALSQLGTGPFLILYGDIVVQEPIDKMLDLHRTSGALVTLAVHDADHAEGKGIVDVDESGRVRRFAEKERRPAGPVLINSGIYLVESEIVSRLEAGVFCDFGEHLFPRLLEDGARITAFRLGSPVIDIGTPEGLSLARAALAADSAPPRTGP